MKKVFDLSSYYKSKKYILRYIDTFISDRCISLSLLKKDYLISLDISPTSFRRALRSDCKISSSILNILLENFDVKFPTKETVDTIEELVNHIYLGFYFKKDILHYSEKVDYYIEENTTLTPILYFFKLLINLCSFSSISDAYDTNKDLINKILRYKNYYDEDFCSIIKIIDLYFDLKINNFEYDLKNGIDKFKGIYLHVLSSKAYCKNNFPLALYYAQQCKIEMQKDYNFERILSINLMIYTCLNYIEEYEPVYKDSFRQISYYDNNEPLSPRLLATVHNYYIACIGLEKYDEVISLYKFLNKDDILDGVYNMISYFHVDKTKCKKILKEYESHKLYLILETIYNYLFNKISEKVFFEEIQKFKINKNLAKVLGKIKS